MFILQTRDRVAARPTGMGSFARAIVAIGSLTFLVGCVGNPLSGKSAPDEPVMAPEASQAISMRETDVVGKWRADDGTKSCRIFLTMIKWRGGMRATVRDCDVDRLQSVESWTVQDEKTVMLLTAEDSVAADLQLTGPNQLDGTLSDGTQLGLSRTETQKRDLLNAGTQPPAGAGSQAALQQADLLGAWAIEGPEKCELFLTLTGASGGLRASTRKCSDASLKQISSWQMRGSEVSLKGVSGTVIARLAPSGTDKLAGHMATGGTVSASR